MTIDEAFSAWERTRTSTDWIREARGGGADDAFRAGAEWAAMEINNVLSLMSCGCARMVREHMQDHWITVREVVES